MTGSWRFHGAEARWTQEGWRDGMEYSAMTEHPNAYRLMVRWNGDGVTIRVRGASRKEARRLLQEAKEQYGWVM